MRLFILLLLLSSMASAQNHEMSSILTSSFKDTLRSSDNCQKIYDKNLLAKIQDEPNQDESNNDLFIKVRDKDKSVSIKIQDENNIDKSHLVALLPNEYSVSLGWQTTDELFSTRIDFYKANIYLADDNGVNVIQRCSNEMPENKAQCLEFLESFQTNLNEAQDSLTSNYRKSLILSHVHEAGTSTISCIQQLVETFYNTVVGFEELSPSLENLPERLSAKFINTYDLSHSCKANENIPDQADFIYDSQDKNRAYQINFSKNDQTVGISNGVFRLKGQVIPMMNFNAGLYMQSEDGITNFEKNIYCAVKPDACIESIGIIKDIVNIAQRIVDANFNMQFITSAVRTNQTDRLTCVSEMADAFIKTLNEY